MTNAAPKKSRTGDAANALDVQSAVDRVLLSHGEYIPVELLIDQGRLAYSDYEAWRCGELTSLEEALAGNRTRIHELLGEAARWARRLGFEAAPVDYAGWGAMAGRALTLAAEADLAMALATHYRRRDPSPQLDLFLDAGEAVLIKDLRAALATRQAQRAQSLVEDLASRFPEHRLRSDAERLCDALAHLEASAMAASAEEEFQRLRGHLAPAAERLLGVGSRDFMTPFWRRLAARVDGLPFDPAHPERHASWLYAQCLDWRGVRASALAGGDPSAEAVLLTRLVEAELRLGERLSAIVRLAQLCWCFPAQAETLLDDGGFADAGVAAAWEAYQDLDVDPPPAVDWFPAWLLLSEPGLARAWPIPLAGEAGQAGRGFAALRKLVAADGVEQEAIELRRALQRAHPGFLALYLQWRTARRD